MKEPILIIKRTFIRSDCLESLTAFSGLAEPKKEQLQYSRPTTKGLYMAYQVAVPVLKYLSQLPAGHTAFQCFKDPRKIGFLIVNSALL